MLIELLISRSRNDGGFSMVPMGAYRMDATCWAIIALSGHPDCMDIINLARKRIVGDQLPDGRVCLSQNHPESFWPTSLAIFAWHNTPDFGENQIKAINFLLNSSGTYWKRTDDLSSAHDTNLKGWPWIFGTHSWVEPTSLAMMALSLSGYGNHERIIEAAKLLMNRHLTGGGWNYGNTSVFGQTLHPMPLSTGMALNALKDHTSKESVERSLIYLKNRVKNLRTPRSLAWSLLGLGVWDARNEFSHSLIDSCLNYQNKYGAYDTESLSLLMIAKESPAGLDGIFQPPVKL